MPASKKKVDVDKNRRLDAFLTELQIEQDKKQQILRYVEDLTFNAIHPKAEPKLRLKKWLIKFLEKFLSVHLYLIKYAF